MRGTLAFVVLVTSSAATAQLPASTDDRNSYFGASWGHAHIKLADDFLRPPFPSAFFFGETFTKDETGTAYKLYFGRRLARYFAVEGGYINFGEFSARREWINIFSGPVGRGSIGWTFKSRGPFLDLVGVAPFGNFQIFAKGGLIYAFSSADYDVVGSARAIFQPHSHESDRSARFKWGAGSAYDFSKKAGLRLEYERAKGVGNEHTTGKGDIGLTTIGVFYRF